MALAATVSFAAAASAVYQVATRPAAHANVPAAAPAQVVLGLSVTPARVAYGGTAHVAGTVTDASGTPVARRAVEVLVARADSPQDAIVVATPLSDESGTVTAAFRPVAGSAVWLRFAGEQRLAPALSETARVSVEQEVTVQARTRALRGRWVTTFTGAVTPVRSGTVRLERRDGASWRGEAAGTLTAKGTYTFTVRHAGAGRHAYRVVRDGDAAYDAATAAYDLRLGRLPAAGRPSTPVPAVRPVKGRLLVTGDSLAFYLGQQLKTARGARPTDTESRHSSGLARREYFDWVSFAHRQVATAAPGAVVVFLGGNDCQPLRANWTGAWTSVGTERWAAEYRRRATELMRAYAGNAARPVYWIGLPIAEKPDIAACYRLLNAATAAAARDVRGVAWVDSWSVYSVNGQYSDTVEGVVARQEDGIHLTFAGTRLLTRRILPLVR